jgi:PiT family inorganic phosphate transporter
MMLGGLLNARRVALVMSGGIAQQTHLQGFSANLVTGILVVFASRFGLPVSTTHVSVGSLAGIGVANGFLNTRTLTQILFAWVLTLPVSAVLAMVFYPILR